MSRDTIETSLFDYRWMCTSSNINEMFKKGISYHADEIVDKINSLNKISEGIESFHIAHRETNNTFDFMYIESFNLEDASEEIEVTFEFLPSKSLITNSIYAMQKLTK